MRLTHTFAVAPMMAHTHQHWRYFFRLISAEALLFTEMTPAERVVAQHRSAHADERVALQLGGFSTPEAMRDATRLAIGEHGYAAVDLNCGCPSSTVTGACAGAALMLHPLRTAELAEAMVAGAVEAGGVASQVTVKLRLGAKDAATYQSSLHGERSSAEDDRDFAQLSEWVQRVAATGVRRFYVHARLALLDLAEGGPSTGTWQNSRTVDNRHVPPLRPEVVLRLAHRFPEFEFVTNGGIASVAEARRALCDAPPNLVGVMVGRAVVNHPAAFAAVDQHFGAWGSSGGALSRLTREGSRTHDRRLCSPPRACTTRGAVLAAYADYCDAIEPRLRHEFEQAGRAHVGFDERRRLIGAYARIAQLRAWSPPGPPARTGCVRTCMLPRAR